MIKMINQDGLIYLGEVLFKYNGVEKDVAIPEGIKRIHHDAFAKTGITSIRFPQTLEIVGSGVFRHCSNLREVVFSDNVKQIGDDVFLGCKLDKVVFPRKLEELGDNRQNIKEIIMPEEVSNFNCKFSGDELCMVSITPVFSRRRQNVDFAVWNEIKTPMGTRKIPKYFLAASNVRKVIIGGNIETVPLKTCANNFYLREIVMEEGVKAISSTAFDFTYLPKFQVEDSKYLEITFPNSVTDIGENFLKMTRKSERKILFKVHANSYAHHFSKVNGFPFILV